jgi:RES domain-containing protein
MVYDPALLDAIEGLGAGEFDAVVWRHMFKAYDPARANTRGARWNPAGVAAVYASLERDTAVAEAEYAISSQPVRPRASRSLYRIRIGLERVVDLSDRSTLASLGVGASELEDMDQNPCRAIGGAAHWLDRDGLLVPSARADGTNLVVFPDRSNVDAPFEVLNREELS